MLCGQVCAFVPSSLAFYLDVGPIGGVDDEAPPTVCHKGCCHGVKGLACGITWDLLSLSILPKVTPLHYMHKCTADTYLSSFIVFFHIGICFDADPVDEVHPAIPAASVLLVCLFCNALAPDWCSIGTWVLLAESMMGLLLPFATKATATLLRALYAVLPWTC